jgi:hypothetical protein
LKPERFEGRGLVKTLCQIVLVLIVSIALVSPFTQNDSPDLFPVAGDDVELSLISILSGLGIFLLLARWLRIIPALAGRIIPGPEFRPVMAEGFSQRLHAGPLHLVVPLRI